MLSRNFDRAELLQMRCRPLRVEEREFERAQTFNQSDQGDLRGVRYAMKHRFAKERTAYRDAVQAAGKPALLPGFHRMRVAQFVQSRVALNNLATDPGIFPFRTRNDHFGKRVVDCGFKYSLAQETSQRMRGVKIFQWQDRAWIRRKPFDRVVLHRHGENTKPIALK